MGRPHKLKVMLIYQVFRAATRLVISENAGRKHGVYLLQSQRKNKAKDLNLVYALILNLPAAMHSVHERPGTDLLSVSFPGEVKPRSNP